MGKLQLGNKDCLVLRTMRPNGVSSPVLLVDDRWEDVFLLQRLLRAAKTRHPIHSAIGGDDAMSYLQHCLANRSQLPCVIFLDIEMPDKDGFQVLQWVREQEPFDNVVMVMLSESEDPAHIERGYELGAQSFLTKFPSSKTLCEILKLADQPVGTGQKIPRRLRPSSP